MAEELQSLLEKIHQDGIEKAGRDAERILAAAVAQADSIVKEGTAKADGLLKKARQDETIFVERGRKALEQAARDVVLSVGDSIGQVLKGLVSREVAVAMSGDTIESMLIKVVESYMAHGGNVRMDVLVNPQIQKSIGAFMMAKFAQSMKKGMEVKGDASVVSGFKVSMIGENLQHDFTNDAVAAALSQLLRPQLAEIVKSALAKKS